MPPCGVYLAHIPFHVAAMQRVALTSLAQFLARIFTNGLKQGVSRCAVALLHRDKRLIYQTRENIQHPAAIESIVGANPFYGLESKATSEDGEAMKQDALVHEEQVVAPVNHCSQRLAPRK